MRCIAITKNSGRKGQFGQELRDGHRCKRNCADDSDFCKQHNPLTGLDDTMCAICLDDIKNPMKVDTCRHVFCKDCISKSVLYTAPSCPCCRAGMDTSFVADCIKHNVGKYEADKFLLNIDIALRPYMWYGTRPWTADMRRRFFAVHRIPE